MNEPSETPDVVRIERPATGGGVGRLGDGRVVFVRHSLVGELVEVDVTERATSFARGDAVRIIEASAERVNAPCSYAHPRGCGGCDLQHASAAAQSSWKTSLVSEQLRRVAGVQWNVEVVPAPSEPKGSRTRLRCAVTEDGRRRSLPAPSDLSRGSIFTTCPSSQGASLQSCEPRVQVPPSCPFWGCSDNSSTPHLQCGGDGA